MRIDGGCHGGRIRYEVEVDPRHQVGCAHSGRRSGFRSERDPRDTRMDAL